VDDGRRRHGVAVGGRSACRTSGIGEVTVIVTGRAVTVAALAAQGSSHSTAWNLAQAASRWWPGWLHPLGVDCSFEPACIASVPTQTMADVAGRLSHSDWSRRAAAHNRLEH